MRKAILALMLIAILFEKVEVEGVKLETIVNAEPPAASVDVNENTEKEKEDFQKDIEDTKKAEAAKKVQASKDAVNAAKSAI